MYVLAPARLRATAASLAGAGVSAADVSKLAAFINESEDDAAKARRYLAAVVSDPERALDAVRSVRCYMSTTPKDYEFGSKDRQDTLERIREHDRVWEAEVAQRKASGMWPPSKYRDPHPWENGKVIPPPPDTEVVVRVKPDAVHRERLTHLLDCAKAMKKHGRKIPGHMLSEIVWLKAHWEGFDIPPEAIEARRVLERT